MSKFRHIQTPIIALLLVLLAAPALAACCVWSEGGMACCDENAGNRLVTACCVDADRQAPDRPVPAQAAKSLRFDPTPVGAAAAVSTARFVPVFAALSIDGADGRPASDRLYLRLSVIRR